MLQGVAKSKQTFELAAAREHRRERTESAVRGWRSDAFNFGVRVYDYDSS